MGTPKYVTLPTPRPRFRLLPLTLLCLLTILTYLYLSHNPTPSSISSQIPPYKPITPRIAKVSMLFGKPNRAYQKAVASHERHAAIHGYPVYILRNEMQEHYWNKPSYMISVLLKELEKEPGDRVEWLMWFDADSIIMNPDLAAEIFLPPHVQDGEFSNTHLLVTKDFNGLNTGIFFIRVHEWSVRLMAKSLTFGMYRPEIDLGVSADQRAMEILLNETDFRPNTAFVPKRWFNSYLNDFQRGDLLVHFPGMVERDAAMLHWLYKAEGREKGDYVVSMEETGLKGEIRGFWDRMRRCRRAGEGLKHQLKEMGRVPDSLWEAAATYRETCWYMSDDEDALEQARKMVDQAFQLSSE